MASYLIAIFLGGFSWSAARARCFTRHALLICSLPLAASLVPALASLVGVEVSFGMSFGGIFLFDFVALAFAIGAFLVSKRLIPRFAGAYTRYWEAMAQ